MVSCEEIDGGRALMLAAAVREFAPLPTSAPGLLMQGVSGVPWDLSPHPLADPRDPLTTHYSPLNTLLGPPDFGPGTFG